MCEVRKFLLAGLMACIMAVGAFAVYADTIDKGGFPYRRGYGHMREIDFNRPETQEEAEEAWRAHYDEMDKFHRENGIRRGGHCHDINGRGMMGRY